ncbi:MAG: hypothetical protein ACPGO3_10435 [Magnetospiraceae bacterium]
MNVKSIAGLIILLVVAGGAVLFTQLDLDEVQRKEPDKKAPVTISLFFGGEKKAFLANPQVQEILKNRYAITLDSHSAGSIEMVTTLNTADKHCVWPSNQVAVEFAKNSGKTVLSDDNIFNSPIVFYTWDKVADALIAAGIVEIRDKVHYVVDTRKLIQMIIDGKKWKEDLNLNVYGSIKIFSTDPRKSNSGNMWSGLLANLLNNGDVVTAETIAPILPQIKAYFKAMGHMEHSSGDIFENFLSQGMGSRPIIVGYENQLVEFVLANPDNADFIRQKIRVLYPEPTVYSSHPLISLRSECKRLATALQDQELQDIAWVQHGFRTGLLGVQNDPSVLTVTGIPSSVDLVIPMPRATEMQAIIDALE